MLIHPWSSKNSKHRVSFVCMFKYAGRSKVTLRNVGFQESSERWYKKITAVLLLNLLMFWGFFFFLKNLKFRNACLTLKLLIHFFLENLEEKFSFSALPLERPMLGSCCPQEMGQAAFIMWERMKYYFRPNWDRRLHVFFPVVDLMKDIIFLQTLVLK